MGLKLSKIIGEAQDKDLHSQGLGPSKSAILPVDTSAADNEGKGNITIPEPSVDLSPSAPPEADPLQPVTGASSAKSRVTDKAPSVLLPSENVDKDPSTAHSHPSSVPTRSDDPEDEEIGCLSTKHMTAEHAEQLLAGQLTQLKDGPLKLIPEADVIAFQETVLQLCECKTKKCRAASLLLAVNMRDSMTLAVDNKALQQQLKQAQDAQLKAETLSIGYLNDSERHLTDFIALRDQLADPQSSQYLRFEVKQLERENADIPRLRQRVESMQEEHNELVRVRSSNATLQGMVDDAEKFSENHAQLQIAHENMKRELNSLKKRADATEALEVKNKLNQARSTNEELLATNKKLEEELENAQSIINASNDFSMMEGKDDDGIAGGKDETENSMGFPKFQLSSKAFNTEAVRALNYINKLNGTVVKRAAKVSGEQAGMGWDAFGRLEQLMEWVSKEGRTATKLVMGMDGAKDAKMASQGFPTLPLGSGKEKKGGRKV